MAHDSLDPAPATPTPASQPAEKFCIGLTGGIGSGKSAVTQIFQRLGAQVIDADVVAHQLTGADGAAMAALRLALGDWICAVDGSLDRNAVRQRTFANRAEHRTSRSPDRASDTVRTTLESILHPLIRCEMLAQLARPSGCYAVLAIPLLVENRHWQSVVSRTLLIDAPEAMQIARVEQRSQLAPQAIRSIMQHQASRLQRLLAIDDVLCNDRGLESLATRVTCLHWYYCFLAKQSRG